MVSLLFNISHCPIILSNSRVHDHYDSLSAVFFLMKVQCFSIPGFNNSVEISEPQVAALNPQWIMSLEEKNGRTELHYTEF